MSNNIIPPDVLAAVGRAALGHHWQVPLSEQINMSPRMVRYYAKQGAPVRLRDELKRLLKEKAAEVERAAALLDRLE